MTSIYNKTKANKDRFGNNSCHYIFEIEDPKKRYEFLRVLIENKVGDLYERNKQGYLPTDLSHCMNTELIPQDLQKYFTYMSIEQAESDFMITTSRLNGNTSKEKIICEQLNQIGLGDCYNIYPI